VSARELVRQRVTNALVIGDGIADAADGAALKEALMALPLLASSLSDEMVPGQDVAAVISGQYRAALARAAALAEDRMRQDGAGGAPVDYALLVLGSAGRDESMLAADQDHAIVYADPDVSMADRSSSIQTWFETLGGHIADFLDQGGIPYCPGGVMSSRPSWCRSLSGWRQAIRGWVGKAAPADLLNVDIFFDFVPVYGQAALANQLQQAISGRATRRSAFLKLLARNAGSHSTGRTFFGGFRTENGRFNVKLNILLPLVETVRVMAISRGVAERGSAARIAALIEGGDVPAEVGELAEDIHMAIRLVLRQQITDIEAGLPPTSLVDLRALGATEKNILKAVTDRVGRLDSLLQAGLF
jgi:signal-transduction protein with cAMP-binding, CBS, and nucleotidyltransferase domain